MNRVLDWDPEAGRIRLEPGVTIRQLWEYVLEDGWWPAVVPGTAKPTIGGCAGMNVHGKNAWKAGTIGDHIYEFDLMLPSGEVVTCNRQLNGDLFHGAIGGFGMLGTFTALTLSLKRVYSGQLEVDALASRNLSEMMAQFEVYLPKSDYLVGWIDAFAGGKSLGRGQIQNSHHFGGLSTKDDVLCDGKGLHQHKVLMNHTDAMLDSNIGIIDFDLFSLDAYPALGGAVETVKANASTPPAHVCGWVCARHVFARGRRRK